MAQIIKNFPKMIQVAHDIHNDLSNIQHLQNGLVHFRPAAGGVTLVGLLPQHPQRGKGGYKARYLKANFLREFNKWCVNINQGRPTPEKQLQSFLISNAYQHQRLMQVLQANLPQTEDSKLIFITDEISLNNENGKVVCDILAINQCENGVAPVLMELKSKREMKRLIEQLENFEEFLRQYQAQFEALFSAILGENIVFTEPLEKWLVWPALKSGKETQETELLKKGIRIVSFTVANPYQFYIGQRPDW